MLVVMVTRFLRGFLSGSTFIRSAYVYEYDYDCMLVAGFTFWLYFLGQLFADDYDCMLVV